LQNKVTAATEAVLMAERSLFAASIDESESQMQVGDISGPCEEPRQELEEQKQQMSKANRIRGEGWEQRNYRFMSYINL
jgi:hypothetical protein